MYVKFRQHTFKVWRIEPAHQSLKTNQHKLCCWKSDRFSPEGRVRTLSVASYTDTRSPWCEQKTVQTFNVWRGRYDEIESLKVWVCIQRRSRLFHIPKVSSWWFQPLWKPLVKLDHFPRDRGENNKYLKPPPCSTWCGLNWINTFWINLQFFSLFFRHYFCLPSEKSHLKHQFFFPTSMAEIAFLKKFPKNLQVTIGSGRQHGLPRVRSSFPVGVSYAFLNLSYIGFNKTALHFDLLCCRSQSSQNFYFGYPSSW